MLSQLRLFVLICSISLFTNKTTAQDTCKIGIFIIDLYDLNLTEKSFAAKFWLWGLYKNDSLKLLENMELIETNEFEYSLPTVEKEREAQLCSPKRKSYLQKRLEYYRFSI